MSEARLCGRCAVVLEGQGALDSNTEQCSAVSLISTRSMRPERFCTSPPSESRPPPASTSLGTTDRIYPVRSDQGMVLGNEVEDEVVWDALLLLFGSDQRHEEGSPYLSDDAQTAGWSGDLRAARDGL